MTLHSTPARQRIGQTDVNFAYDLTVLTPDDAAGNGDLDQSGQPHVDTYFDTTRHGERPCGAVECYTVLDQRQPLTLKGRVSVDELLGHLGDGRDLLIARGDQNDDGSMTIHEVHLVVCDQARLDLTLKLLAEMDPRVLRRIDRLLGGSLRDLQTLH